MNSNIKITNSTNNKGLYNFSLYSLDPIFTYDTIGNYQYIFEIQTYNLLGNGPSSFIQFNYSPPNSNAIKF
jgi:hypothetical protein